ncbi:hypothetical protein ACO0LC_15040 [Undibacterium sp. JH2W]|uniref:hypothetical protein n=1 Tax=Undibacterium sp. JH2W TaxID=3413037 RepID=UPI003BF14F15
MLKHILVSLAIMLMTFMSVIAAPGYVIIDASKPHVTVYTSIPKSLPDADIDKVRAQVSAQAGASMETWDAFKNNLNLHVEARIQKNDYPELSIKEGVMAFLEKYEGIPLGLAWNGGIAFTYNDYVYTQKTYQTYLKKPDSVTRTSDRRRDPVHPVNHFGALMSNLPD